MKKLIFLLLAVSFLFICACGEKDAPTSVAPDSVTVCGEVINAHEKNGEKVFYLPSFACGTDTGDARVMHSENLPALFISTENGLDEVNESADHSVSASGSLTVFDKDGNTLCGSVPIKIKGRGNATWHAEKKPYQIELEAAESLLGLCRAKKFILLANYYDPSLLRNRIALDIAKKCGAVSTPDCVPVDLYADGDYLGSYLLCEKIGIGEGRIEIADLEKENKSLLEKKPSEYGRGGVTEGAENGSAKWYELPVCPSDISGGYLLEVDYTERYPDEKCGFVTSRGLPVVIKSPEYVSEDEVNYIKEYFCDFEDALFSDDGVNGKEIHYSEYADMDSLVFRYLIEEFTLNIDGGISSFYIYKDKDENGGKLNFSCAWDYDCAFGNYALYADLTSPETLFAASSETRNAGSMPSIFFAMMKHDEIRAAVKEYYSGVFKDAVTSVLDGFDECAGYVSSSAEMDGDLYGDTSRFDFYKADAGKGFADAVLYLRDFICARVEFFDKTFK